jgi:PleD family two-component response regulator
VLSTFELFQRAERAMEIARSRNEELRREVAVRKQAEEESRQLALIDPLTGLYNRRGFTALATHLREIARRQQRLVQVLLIDLDRFKRINDTFGHTVGDRALVEFAQILTATFRKSDLVPEPAAMSFASCCPSRMKGSRRRSPACDRTSTTATTRGRVRID